MNNRTVLNFSFALGTVIVVGAFTAGGFALAQTTPGIPPSSTNAMIDYHPTMADLMTAYVQPRHIKLGLAAKQRNWTYAAYEANELKNAFARIERDVPTFDNNNMVELIGSTVAQPLTEAIAAAKAGDAKTFDAAYSEVTKSCNVCHDQFKKPFMVIKEPNGSQFPDQEFGPTKK
jgi:hypothetical protein